MSLDERDLGMGESQSTEQKNGGGKNRRYSPLFPSFRVPFRAPMFLFPWFQGSILGKPFLFRKSGHASSGFCGFPQISVPSQGLACWFVSLGSGLILLGITSSEASPASKA